MNLRFALSLTLSLACTLPAEAQQYRPNNGSQPHGYRSPYRSGVSRSSGAQQLGVRTFNLAPREPITENIEQVRAMADGVVQVVRTILYAQTGERAAAAEGRRMWYDANTLQLTITDYPSNLRVVSDYIRSLDTMGAKQKSEIAFLKHQDAAQMQELVSRVYGIAPATGAAQAASVTRTLRVEGELTFGDLRIRVVRVNENDINDDNDDSVELVIRTPTNSEDRTIEEFRSEFVDQYEINVIEVRPSGTPGEGSARIEVRLNPALAGQGQVAPVVPVVPLR